MKNILLFFIFRLFLNGVFGESVSVMEGDSVTLHTGLTEIQKDDVIEWRFGVGSVLIARINRPANINMLYDDGLGGTFKDRLKLQEQNGDLTIRNIRTTDSGDYKVTISSTRKTVNVKVVPADEEKSVTVEVTVLEGDSVTLNTDPTYIQQRYDVNHVKQWRFGQQKSPEAEIINTSDERFRDRLKLDNQTGSLNIKNITATDAGLYEADISSSSSRYTIHHTQSFNVTISDEMKSVSVKEGETVTLQTVTEIQNDGLIHWMFGDFIIAEIRKAAPQFYTSDGPDGKFRLRLYLDHQTGSLNIINTRTTDSGDYQLKISSSRRTINRRIPVTVTDSGLSPAAIVGIVVGFIVLLVAVGGVIYRCCCKKSKRRPLMYEHGANIPDLPPEEGQDPQLLENGETKLTKPVEMENRSS